MSSFHKVLPSRPSESPPLTPGRTSTTVGTPCNSLTTTDAPIKRAASGFFHTPTLDPGSSTRAIPISPTKCAGPVSLYGKLAGHPNAVTSTRLATRDTDYDDVVASIIKLDESMWFEEGRAAVFKEKLRNRKGAEELQRKLAQAFEAAARAQFMYADILRKCPSLDPDSHAFCIFKTLTLATLLDDDPNLAGQLKAEVENAPSNYNYKKTQEWIDEVASDAEGLIEDVEIACAQDDKYKLGDGFGLRDCLVAMSHHFEHHYVRLCNIYPEYSKIPKIAREEDVTSCHGRMIRERRTRHVEFKDIVMVGSTPARTRPTRSQRATTPQFSDLEDNVMEVVEEVASCNAIPLREKRTRHVELEDFVMEESTPTHSRFTRSKRARNPDYDNGEKAKKVAEVGEGTSYHGRPVRERYARKLEYDEIVKGDAMSWRH